MAIKKSQLYSTLWEACNALRGGMDASQYKDYVLVVLFLKYISDKAKTNTDSLIEVPDGCTFEDILKLKNKVNIGEEMNKILERIADENGLQGVITNADFADENKLGKGKELVDTVSKLIAVFENENLDFSNNRAADDDLIGDAYEYLMRNFASQSGKSKGQFYTPAEVSRIMAKIIGISKDERPMISIYDPTCGSGSLLLRAKAEAKNAASIDGQEKDLATIGMAKMSMIIHGVDDADLRHGDTLNSPLHKINDHELTQFNYVVANPPFSLKGWMKTAKEDDDFSRWGNAKETAPVPPGGCGDYAFLLHIVASLKSDGHAACILPHGVLFRGGAESEIRKFLVKRRIISGIIGLPTNLFFGTGIPACIIIIDKQNMLSSDGIFMIDAKEGFMKDGAKNRLREMDICRIVDAWEKHQDIPHYARFVSFEEIEANNYNLNIPRYVSPEDKEIIQDITAHIHGGLPAHDIDEVLASYWRACPTLKDELFQMQENGYYCLKVDTSKLADTIKANDSYKVQVEHYKQGITHFFNRVSPDLYALEIGFNPKEMITRWGQLLLEDAEGQMLVDPYNVYEILMNYWAETMQDDCYMISRDGWTISYETTKKNPSYEDITCDLLPVNVILDTFFSQQVEAIATMNSRLEELNAKVIEMEEEYPDETDDGIKAVKSRLAAAECTPPKLNEETVLQEYLSLLAIKGKDGKKQQETYCSQHEEVFVQFDKINKTSVLKRIKEIQAFEPLDEETRSILKAYNELSDRVSAYKAEIKNASAELLTDVLEKYASLDENEIKDLVVSKKWVKTITNKCEAALKNAIQGISSDINVLVDRYSKTLLELDAKLNDLRSRVNAYLVAMGKHTKEGAMQQLLTGKTRLPGFCGEWVEKKVGELGILTGAGVDKLSIDSEKPVRLVNYLDVMHRDFIYDHDLNFWVTANDKKIEKCNVIQGDVFFTPSSEMPYDIALSAVAMENIPGACYSYHIYRLRFTEEIDLKFKAYMFKTNSFYKQASTLCEGSGKRYVISMPKFRSMVVRYPKDIEEQRAIANILSEMDEEIHVLEEERDKYALIKQGMMQELLTGKTRLI